jgi:cellulose biosynthesis protein BcsQ
LQLLGYLVSRFKRLRAYQKSYLTQLRSNFGFKTFDTVIPDLAQFERSVTDAVVLTGHAPNSAAASIAREFFDETLRRCAELKGMDGGGQRSGVSSQYDLGDGF